MPTMGRWRRSTISTSRSGFTWPACTTDAPGTSTRTAWRSRDGTALSEPFPLHRTGRSARERKEYLPAFPCRPSAFGTDRSTTCASIAGPSARPRSWSSTINSVRSHGLLRRAPRAILALACIAFLFAPAIGRGEDRRKILVLLEQTKPAFLTRLRAELGSSGFGVAVATPSTFPPERPEIEQLAQQEGASVGLLLLEAGAGLEIWVIDPSTGKSTFREVILGFYQPHEAPEVIAIRVVETLRVTLMDVEHPHARAPATRWHPAPEVLL